MFLCYGFARTTTTSGLDIVEVNTSYHVFTPCSHPRHFGPGNLWMGCENVSGNEALNTIMDSNNKREQRGMEGELGSSRIVSI